MGPEPAAHGNGERLGAACEEAPRRRGLRSFRGRGESRSLRGWRPACPLSGAADRRRRRLHGVQDRGLHGHARPGTPRSGTRRSCTGRTATCRRHGASRATGSRCPSTSRAADGPFDEPVFHAALVGGSVYVPGFGGSIYKVSKSDGHLVARIQPFGSTLDPDTYVAGPLTADAAGNVYYNALKLDHDKPWDVNPPASYLVKVSPDNTARTATIASLTPGAPAAGDQCLGIFRSAELPWPPSPDAVPSPVICGVQRVARELRSRHRAGRHHLHRHRRAPLPLRGLSRRRQPRPDAEVERLARQPAHTTAATSRCRPTARPAAAAPALAPASTRRRTGPAPASCSTTRPPSPVVLPDGGILYGAFTRYPYFQGHLMKFSSSGQFLASYPFGWDDTPAIYPHDGTYSIITKDNHYTGDSGSYCHDRSRSARWTAPPATRPPRRPTSSPGSTATCSRSGACRAPTPRAAPVTPRAT